MGYLSSSQCGNANSMPLPKRLPSGTNVIHQRRRLRVEARVRALPGRAPVPAATVKQNSGLSLFVVGKMRRTRLTQAWQGYSVPLMK